MARAEGELPALHLSPPPTASAAFPLGGWLCADLAALDALAGEASVPPIVRPVQLSLVPDRLGLGLGLGIGLGLGLGSASPHPSSNPY